MSKTKKGKPVKESANRQGSDRKRKAPRSAFKPGQSGNPAGRPPVNPDIKEALKAACPRAVQVLTDLMENAISEEVRHKSAVTIVERVLGKVAQPLELTGKDGSAVNIEGRTRVEFDVSPERLASIVGLLGGAGALTAGAEAEATGADTHPEVEQVHPANADAEADSVPPPEM